MVILLLLWHSSNDLVSKENLNQSNIEYNQIHNKDTLHLNYFRSFIGIKEKGNNRGELIDKINRHLKVPLGSPYCASSICYSLDKVGYKIPLKRNAMALSFKNKNSISAIDVFKGKFLPKKGMIAVWQNGNTRFGHAGIVEHNWLKNGGIIAEGNTSPDKRGSQREGNGFYYKNRKVEPFNLFRIVCFTYVARA